MQDLFVAAESAESDTQATQYVAEKLPVGAKELWSLLSVGDQPLCLSDSVGKTRCSHLELRRPAWRRTSACAYSAGALSSPGLSQMQKGNADISACSLNDLLSP